MSKGRLEAFSDGVIAILITIMVLELRPPVGEGHEDVTEWFERTWPIFLAYALSFANVGIYWVNHHHLLQAARHISGRVLWANLLLLFFLSLFPFTTDWMGESHFDSLPVALYGIAAILAAASYSHLVRELRRIPGQPEALMAASGTDRKGILSLLLYAIGVPVALLGFPIVSLVLYVVVALTWIVPDARVERALGR